MRGPRTRWRPEPPPGNIIKVQRETDGVTETALVAYIAEAVPEGDMLKVRCEGPAGLLREIPLPFEPPRIASATDPDGFIHWWRQIHYCFDLPKPALIPPLPGSLPNDDAEMVARFIETTGDLATASVMSDAGGINVSIDADGVETVLADFPKRDIQIGFTTLLRQCHGQSDEARYDAVFECLRRAASASADADQAERLQQLHAWHSAVTGLRKKSLDQRVRDRFVTEEGWKVWDYQEESEPAELMRIFNYGDLIHWGKTRGKVVRPDEDEYAAANQRTLFFQAALGLAHITIGFGEMARALTTPRNALWLP